MSNSPQIKKLELNPIQLRSGDYVKVRNVHEKFWVRITHVAAPVYRTVNLDFIEGFITTDLNYGHLYGYQKGDLVCFNYDHIEDTVR